MLVKGVLTPEDARLAAEHGVAGVVVSNHGGRQLDTVPSGAEALPAIADAVGDHVDVLVDGGIRRGTDVLKALALGARAVMVGRPVLWGLAVGGEAGARAVLDSAGGRVRRRAGAGRGPAPPGSARNCVQIRGSGQREAGLDLLDVRGAGPLLAGLGLVRDLGALVQADSRRRRSSCDGRRRPASRRRE